MRKIIILGTLAVLGLAATAQASDSMQSDDRSDIQTIQVASSDDNGQERNEWKSRSRERSERSGRTSHEARERAERSSAAYEQQQAREGHDEAREHSNRR